MVMTADIEADLTFFFAKYGEAQRSTFGAMLDRARNQRCDSDGKALGRTQNNWNWRPDGADQVMLPQPPKNREPSYTPDLASFERFGRASGRLRMVERHSRVDAIVLEAFYGDRGNRWKEAAKPVLGEGGQVLRKGRGPGAMAALFRFTDEGRKLISAYKRKLERDAVESMTPDDVLDAIFDALASGKRPELKARIQKVTVQAEKLWIRACSAYVTAVACEKRSKLRQRNHGGQRRRVLVSRHTVDVEVA